MTVTGGLRERKKQRTRETIVREAMALFHERGFDATTVADIAAAADIAPRTFFAYFPAKEDVVFDEFDALHARFAERLRRRPPQETAFDALRAWVLELLTERDPRPHDEARRELIRSTPSLQARERANLAEFERLLAEGVAADLHVAADSLRPRMVAAAAIAALDVLDDADVHQRLGAEDAMAVMDEALAFLKGGMEGLRRHPRSVL